MTGNNLLLEKLKSIAERSTVHAIPNIASTDRTSVKILWTLCLLASTGYCAYVLKGNISDYLNFGVETVVEITRDTQADFPTVSICSMHICEKDIVDKFYKENPSVEKVLGQVLNQTGNLTQEELNQALQNMSSTEMIKNVKEYLLKTFSQEDLRKMFGQNRTSIKDKIISCQYSSEFCYESDFEYFELNEFQKCYKFNSGKNFSGHQAQIRKARRYGKNYGLQLELFIGLPSMCKSPLTDTFGMILYIHNSTYQITEDSYGILLAPGSETNIPIDRTFVTRNPKPYTDCVQNNQNSNWPSKMVQDTFSIAKIYTQKSCLQVCYQQYMVENLGCYDRYLNFFEDTAVKPCPNKIEQFNLTVEVTKEKFYRTEESKCFESCPPECEYVAYETSASSSQFPTITYSEVLIWNQNISKNFDNIKGTNQFESIKSSVLSVNVFYKSDLITLIKQKPSIPFETFISNVGGTLGLFLGMSLMSMIEILEFILDVCLSYIEKLSEVRKTKPQGFDVHPLKS